MDDQQIENQTNTSDEISLIDLFAVLIKNRKLIIFGTLIVTILVGFYLFLLPILIPSFASSHVKIEYTVTTNEIPLTILTRLFGDTKVEQYSIKELAVENMTNFSEFSKQYKKYPIFSSDIEKLNNYQFNNLIRSIFNENLFEVNASKVSNTININFIINLKKLEDSENLVKNIVADTNKKLELFFMPKINESKSNILKILDSLKKSSGDISDINSSIKLQENLLDIENFISNFNGFLNLNEEPFITLEAKGRLMKLIIVCFASFFIFVFIAFLKNIIDNIKKDPTASKTISDAWKEGK